MSRASVPRGNLAHRNPISIAPVATTFLLIGCIGSVSLLGPDWVRLSALQSLAYVILGVLGRRQPRTADGARRYLLTAGSGCLLLWLVGVLLGRHGIPSLLVLGPLDNLLHLVVGIVLFFLGTLLTTGSAIPEHPSRYTVDPGRVPSAGRAVPVHRPNWMPTHHGHPIERVHGDGRPGHGGRELVG